MVRFSKAWQSVFMGVLVLLVCTPSQSQQTIEYVDNQVIVKLKPELKAVAAPKPKPKVAAPAPAQAQA